MSRQRHGKEFIDLTQPFPSTNPATVARNESGSSRNQSQRSESGSLPRSDFNQSKSGSPSVGRNDSLSRMNGGGRTNGGGGDPRMGGGGGVADYSSSPRSDSLLRGIDAHRAMTPPPFGSPMSRGVIPMSPLATQWESSSHVLRQAPPPPPSMARSDSFDLPPPPPLLSSAYEDFGMVPSPPPVPLGGDGFPPPMMPFDLRGVRTRGEGDLFRRRGVGHQRAEEVR